jgi:hypothetical protein
MVEITVESWDELDAAIPVMVFELMKNYEVQDGRE